ncbi:SNF2 family N-terminal domain-containing protein [Cladochytrium replicatum]|nr:SNF2 family N-terminal domain-containing protein [Cladochytrium replicatum]
MATRLDRLVLLLDNGSTSAVRATAAQQLGEIQRQHPEELYHLLARVLVHLRSKSWETRTAAGLAVEAIAKNVPQWNPPPPVPSSDMDIDKSAQFDGDKLGFDAFDIDNVVLRGAPLLASAGEEYDDFGDLDPKERMNMLRQQIGLGTDLMDVDIRKETDLAKSNGDTANQKEVKEDAQQLLDNAAAKGRRKRKGQDVSAPVPTQPEPNCDGLSARERAALKRKMRLAAKDKGKEKVRVVDISASSMKKRRSENENLASTPVATAVKLREDSHEDEDADEEFQDGLLMKQENTVKNETREGNHVIVEPKKKEDIAKLAGVYGSGDEWPFEGFCEQLSLDLFSPKWEVRHGAAIGLRELIKVHGSGAGKVVGDTNQSTTHIAWLEDLAIRLLCVLALDRFADFLNDTVVVPVRETCAQTLGVVLQWCPRQTCLDVIQKGLLKLIAGFDPSNVAVADQQRGAVRWEVRHAGLIGLKYWLAVRQDLVGDVLDSADGTDSGVLRAILNGLRDHDDDVRAVSSSTLLPITDLIIELLPAEKIFRAIVLTLWDCLQELDDLTSATGSVMDLLSQLMMKSQIAEVMRATGPQADWSLQTLVPRLFPFFRHAIVSVRLSVLRTVGTLLDVSTTELAQSGNSISGDWVTVELVPLLFQNMVIEERKEVLDLTLDVWTKLLKFLEGREEVIRASNSGAPSFVNALLNHFMANWFGLVMTPIGTKLDLRLFFQYRPPVGWGSRHPSTTSSPSIPTASFAAVAGGPKRRGRPPGSGSKQQQREPIAQPQPANAQQTTGFNVSEQDRAMVAQDLTIVTPEDVVRGRLTAATSLGRLIGIALGTGNTDTSREVTIRDLLVAYINSGWAWHRVFTHVIIEEWAAWWDTKSNRSFDLFLRDVGQPFTSGLADSNTLAAAMWDMMNASLLEADSGASRLYTELFNPMGQVKVECETLLALAADYGVSNLPTLPPVAGTQGQTSLPSPYGSHFTLQIAEAVARDLVVTDILPKVPPGDAPLHSQVKKGASSNQRVVMVDRHEQVLDRQSRIFASISVFKEYQQRVEVQVHASAASAIVRMGRVPAKISPVIKPLMNSVKFEANEDMQKRGAAGVGKLLELSIVKVGAQAILNGTYKSPPANDKVVKNLGLFLCSDPEAVGSIETQKHLLEGILSVKNAAAEEQKGAVAKAGPGRKRKNGGNGSEADQSTMDAVAAAVADGNGLGESAQDSQRKARAIVRRGAEYAFSNLCARFDSYIFAVVPKLWEMMQKPLEDLDKVAYFAKHQLDLPNDVIDPNEKVLHQDEYAQEILDSIFTVAAVAPHTSVECHEKIADLLRPICRAVRLPLATIRSSAARCIAVLCKVMTVPAMRTVIDDVTPIMSDAANVKHRQGAVETVHHVVQSLDVSILPYIIFLVVPILGRMSDPDEQVRFLSTNIFAQLVKLMPLESGVPDPEGIPEHLIRQKAEERKFIGQLVGSERVEQFEIPVKINADLRPYQREGVSWLAFLNRYQLHGILCDDMGLGKTLQSICMLASDHHMRAERYRTTGNPDSVHAPSLVVCPSTLTGHWNDEIQTYAGNMKPLLYVGQPAERERLRSQIRRHDVIITSYNIVLRDVAELGQIDWNYCILDEGHVIKNAKSKLTQAVKSMRAMKRLILSGTPIQNNVLELWSLFDFLMPGFLGTERQFNDRFGKPILSSRDAKASSREQEAGALAMEALHKQVLPFLLRRMKEDVLNDLPPKIIQDYYCELSDLQKSLYEDFAKSQAREGVESELTTTGDGNGDAQVGGKGHVFQALQYLRKLVNHPMLVLNESHPKYESVVHKLASQRPPSSIRDLQNAPKLLALEQLLKDCGIGNDAESGADTNAKTVSPHRALIFAQLKPMLDVIEEDLFRARMPNVTYMRMDGSTDPSKRHDVVKKFNEDPSIDVLLLTTHVGGLGLNLTGADTVIFVEHDWNPMKDLQAMDRAHRIGQKRVVNVYRLITRGTLEEKIMGLQKFKLNIASSVINEDNAGLKSMDTGMILDLFSLSSEKEKGAKQAQDKPATGVKAAIQGLDQLWDDEYKDFGDVNEFMRKLG